MRQRRDEWGTRFGAWATRRGIPDGMFVKEVGCIFGNNAEAKIFLIIVVRNSYF
jgi:hypothetical protein